MSAAFTVIPAIDLREGRVVRLYQGDYARQTGYAVDPVTLARRYAEADAEWLHVVDLDGARDGAFANLRVIEAIARSGLRVQAGGGVRVEDDARRLLDAGVARVVVGSLAVREPDRVLDWIARLGAERVVPALDARRRDGAWCLPSAGWTAQEPATLEQLAPRYAAAGARHLLCTDIDRDGTLVGPNLTLYADLAALAPGLAVQASGGVRDVADVRALHAAGVAGVVLGRSLLEGRLTLAEALAC
ncbi:MAG TPA: 1-(5-phosphoribosyl)-5-[(5-phosphoribosylamino)methylideneamino]imidazole-4-carboxamide isomerase [Mizugakiibacter sp.]